VVPVVEVKSLLKRNRVWYTGFALNAVKDF
jgi:hypothetical protein